MKAITKTLLGIFVFTLSTSSSNPKVNFKKEVFKFHTYNLYLDKTRLFSKDQKILQSIDSLEKKYITLIILKNEVICLKDSIKQ